MNNGTITFVTRIATPVPQAAVQARVPQAAVQAPVVTPPKLKRVIEIHHAQVGMKNGKMVLFGHPTNHPSAGLNGRSMRTSRIIGTFGNTVETEHSVYRVLSWAHSIPNTIN